MNDNTLGVGIIGCGNIAGPYASDLLTYPHIRLVGVTDVESEKAQALAAKSGCQSYTTAADLLADPAIDLVVNLTIHHAHYAVTKESLEHGKSVYSEKPLAMTSPEAHELVDLAHSKGLRLGCSPFTYFGEAQQTAMRYVRDERLGPVRIVYAEVNWGRIESWHPAPGPFYEVGALFDVGVYPLTLLTAMFGPARQVTAYGKTLHPDRVTKSGVPFHITAPDWVVVMVELANGTVVRLTTNFYVGHHSKQAGVEFHGDLGSLYLSSWQNFDASVEFAQFGKQYEPVALLREPTKGTPWGRGAAEMAEAMLQDRPHRAQGAHAAHVVDILCAAVESMERHEPVAVHSEISRPAAMEWAT
ncbi:MAG: Gfo/Idh/MocA family oxidoreductase [Chloroflexota bacterium]|nr:Gfo/Idh/MocA family oxidoreductase [Chloroflexota bacterium]